MKVVNTANKTCASSAVIVFALDLCMYQAEYLMLLSVFHPQAEIIPAMFFMFCSV